MSVLRPDLMMRCVVPVIMAGIIAIYGLVVSVLISSDINMQMPLYQGFVQLGAGLSVGLAGLAAGFAIGIVGDAGVRGTAQQPRLFVGMVRTCSPGAVFGGTLTTGASGRSLSSFSLKSWVFTNCRVQSLALVHVAYAVSFPPTLSLTSSRVCSTPHTQATAQARLRPQNPSQCRAAHGMRPLSLSLLPRPLLALLLALPVFATPSPPPAPAAPTTPFDAFQAIGARAPKQPEQPVCCLRPLPSLDGPEEEVLLSFEEWKAKQLAAVQQGQAASNSSPSVVNNSGSGAAADVPLEANASTASVSEGGGTAGVALEQQQQYTATAGANAPYFNIPLTDRFNYASGECSARVHTAHRGAKSASAILSSKKDRYMLSPCSAENQFVVVELCDDIRIDTVQLANYEFFSGVFREFEVWVAKTYVTDTDGWTFAGTYRARNVRGIQVRICASFMGICVLTVRWQSFHTPMTLTDFYRFIRINFRSHYGSEYYCPLSLLRVYGLTHLEHWKWDMWEAESRARRTIEDAQAHAIGPAEVVEKPPQPVHVSANGPADSVLKTPVLDIPITPLDEHDSQQTSSTSDTSGVMEAGKSDSDITVPSSESTILDTATSQSVATTSVESVDEADRSKSSTPPPLIPSPAALPRTEVELADTTQAATSTPHVLDAETKNSDTTHDSSRPSSIPDSLYNSGSGSPMDSPTSASSSASVSSSFSSSSPALSASALQSPSSVSTASTSLSLSSILTSLNLNLSASASRLASASASLSASLSSPGSSPASVNSQSLTVVHPPPPPPPVAAPSSSGESIYRTIMNRLTALETNTTLYARFVEDHTANVRDMLRRLSEDVGRLEGIGKAQAQNYQRTVAEFQRQQRRLELEHRELMTKVVRLTDEVVLEKRLGIAQLCLLLTVLVFMALTRGSRSEPVQVLRGPMDNMLSRTTSLKGWGTRTLNLSGEWVNKLKKSSRPPSLAGHDHEPIRSSEQSIGFASPRKLGFPVRPRTPTSARVPRHHSPQYYPTTPTGPTAAAALSILTQGPGLDGVGARPQIQRVQSGGAVAMTQSLSTGVIGPVPRSAKRWARTAHIHQVKNAPSRHSVSSVEFGDGTKDATGGGAPTPTTRASPGAKEKGKEVASVSLPSLSTESEASEGDGGWVDTDAESSEPELRRQS
ncbi:hypothetical protein EIP86_009525 [Pleurotus ostreatoroseus]|nr:hypothetical protein EIP86_009525 [Pleurotus ostreatoroseus]